MYRKDFVKNRLAAVRHDAGRAQSSLGTCRELGPRAPPGYQSPRMSKSLIQTGAVQLALRIGGLLISGSEGQPTVFVGKSLSISGPVQLQSVLFKGQLWSLHIKKQSHGYADAHDRY